MPHAMSRSAPTLIALLAFASCAPKPPPAAAGPAFDPIAFFDGRTFGSGELSIVLRQPEQVTVQGRGRVRSNGELVLDQRVEREGRPPQNRRWVIRRVGLNTYAGTLTDATGPVQGRAQGNRLRLTYPMKGGLDVEQWLTLSPDGRSADNLFVTKKLGVTVARLRERIEKTE